MTGKLIRLGVFAALTVALTVWIAASIIGVEFGDRYRLTAAFDDVAGLFDGDQVKLAGVNVGRVTGIDVERGRAVVTFEVDENVPLPEDTTVAVRWRNLIGQRYLWLEPGQSDALLADGDHVDRSRNVVDLGQLVNQLAPLAQAVSPDDLNRILLTLLEAFDGNQGNFDNLLADLDVILRTLAERDDTIAQLLADYEVIAGALASRDQQLQTMVENLLAISETFAANDALFDRALTELSGFSTNLDAYLSASAEDFGGVLESLAVLTGTASAHIDELEGALQNLPAMFEALLPAVNRGEWLRVNVLCLTLAPGPCPYPMSLGFGEGETGR